MAGVIEAMTEMAERESVVKLLRAMAGSEIAAANQHDVILNAAADIIEMQHEELDAAMRCTFWMYKKHREGVPLAKVNIGYHSPTLAAAARWVIQRAHDGRGYFFGKKVEVLHAALAVYDEPSGDPRPTVGNNA